MEKFIFLISVSALKNKSLLFMKWWRKKVHREKIEVSFFPKTKYHFSLFIEAEINFSISLHVLISFCEQN